MSTSQRPFNTRPPPCPFHYLEDCPPREDNYSAQEEKYRPHLDVICIRHRRHAGPGNVQLMPDIIGQDPNLPSPQTGIVASLA
ncbi:hypothetical protein PoB_005415300 [Plakobranchus ocellatus]|uniref:Uncharacterized protein n=1 Tax=Plakobranchus ocellatus TaxID=259542 RepID=A0AAV4C802_9GAST|nr:hypothetical protein PoB_005415300 [Plakobranchus ocellatus]